MFFRTATPTVTAEDKEWVEEAFLWFENQYGREYLKNVKIIEPTTAFFPLNFEGSEENAEELVKIICDYMDIKNVRIDLHYFSDKPLELAEGIVTARSEQGEKKENSNTLGTYSEDGHQQYSIGIELELLKDPTNLIATLAHELSHLILLGEGRLEENDEELTDLNCIALGFGIFTCNSIFSFSQWHGTSHHGWQAQRRGYIPEQVATFALALLIHYQNKDSVNWIKYLNRSPRKMVEKNLKYLSTTKDEIRFR